MPTPPLSREKAQEAWDTLQKHGGPRVLGAVKSAAEELGLAPSTFQGRLDKFYEYSHSDPAIEQAKAAVGTNLTPRLAWVKTKNEDGTSHSVLLKPQDLPDDTLDRIKTAFEGMAPAAPVAAPDYADDDLLTIYPIADAHVGMMAWGDETGENYDTDIAGQRIRDWVGRCVSSSPPSGTGVILDVGDTTHADNQTNQTPASKHQLDVDTRHFRTLDVVIAALGEAVEQARTKHKRVVVRILPGNHSPTAYMAIMFALAERYRDEPRVEVQKVPGEFWVHEFGDILLAAHHGHGGKPQQMVMFLADEYAEMWGRTKHRVLFTGHLHHIKMSDIGGCTHEQLRALAPRDAYAVSKAYAARSQLQGITYHRTKGEVQRVKVGA